MATVSTPLSDADLARLRAEAERADEAFRKAADYVLAKNAELYRRLAWVAAGSDLQGGVVT